MSSKLQFGKNFGQIPDLAHIASCTLTNMQTSEQYVIENKPGKQASLKIMHSISQPNNLITPEQARVGLELYGDYVKEELQVPNSHPNIRLLMNCIECGNHFRLEFLSA